MRNLFVYISFIVGIAIGVIVASVTLEKSLDFPNLADIRAFFVWMGQLITSFAPWAILVIAMLCFKKSRETFFNILKGCGQLVGETVELIKGGEEVKFGLLSVVRKARKDPEWARDALDVQVAQLEDDLIRRIENKVVEQDIDKKCNLFYNIFIMNEIYEHYKSDDKAPRFAIHMRDCLYKDSVIQITRYYPTRIHGVSDKVGRRFSIRYGIVGLAWRLKKSVYDPEVSTRPEKLKEKWGMTDEEANRAGKGKQSHLAMLIPKEISDFVLFLDAIPQHVFKDDAGGEIIERLYQGLNEVGLIEALDQIREAVSDVDPILNVNRGP